MTLKEIVSNSQFFTDENISLINYLGVANKAISLINVECKTLFPSIDNDGEDYTYMPKDWFFTLLSPYISYAIKMNDSSLSEADRYLEEFYRALSNFKDVLGSLVENYDEENPDSGISPDMISDIGFGGVYQIDTSNAINIGFFGNDNSAGSW